MRTARKSLIALAILFMPSFALAGQASTTRIETRPFYGATVTLEEGVRVFRPLPSHDRVIINPGGRTPLSLGFEERRSYNYHNYSGYGGAADPAYGYAPYYGGPVAGPTGARHPHMAAKRNVPIGRQHGGPAVHHAPPAGHGGARGH